MFSNFFGSNQSGGGNCSICGSPGTTKTTCPCNPEAKNPNPQKHFNWDKFCPQTKNLPDNYKVTKKTSTKAKKSSTKTKKEKVKKQEKDFSYLATLPLPALESMLEQGILDYEDITRLRQTAPGLKKSTDQPTIKKMARELKSAPVYDRTQKNYPVVIQDQEDPSVSITINKEVFDPAWVPILEPYPEGEGGAPKDEKILGTPLFFKGDQWPQHPTDGYPLSFYAQFYDPNPKSPFGKDLIQTFIGDIEGRVGEVMGDGNSDVVIRRISSQDIRSKKPINPPEIETNDTTNFRMQLDGKGGKIVGWNKIDTVTSNEILTNNTIKEAWQPGQATIPAEEFIYSNDFQNALSDLNIETGGDLTNLLQIGGVPTTWQGIDYRENGVYFNNLYNGYWGDSGSLHSTVNGELYGDMA